jgi:hypothetical protein
MATSIFDQDLILPGSITEIVSDYSYGYDTSLFGTTESVVVIGTAFNGPVGKPVQIYSPEHARYIFGDTYNYTSRKEATLVAEIQDTWDRGCRTIYAVRVSGQSIYKDFQLAIDTKLKLRVSGIFPSNSNKDVYFTFDDAVNAMAIKIFKPSSRATIQEKMQGLVESSEDSVLQSTLEISQSYGLDKESRLVELIKIFNDYQSNNVIRLSIVDEYGADVTVSSKEAQALSVGVLFPGAYLIGRDANKCSVSTDLVFTLADDNNKPYDSFDGMIFKKLNINTDVNKDLPIYAKTVDALNSKFKVAGIVMSEMFDLLAVSGKLDKVYGKNTVDYEEVELTDFELYQKLGSGFAVTAKAELKGSDIKVKETPVSDDNRIAALTDGLYSMLENLPADMRILANGVSDIDITGKIPKKSAFKIATAKSATVFGGSIIAKTDVDKTDLTEAKTYQFVLDKVATGYGSAATVKPLLYTTKTLERVAKVTAATDLDGKVFANGTLFMAMPAAVGTLFKYVDGSVVEMSDSTVFADLIGKIFLVGNEAFIGTDVAGKIEFQAIVATTFGQNIAGDEYKYVIAVSGESTAVYEFDSATLTFEPIGALHSIFDDTEDKTLVTIQSEYFNTNVITIKSAALDFTNVEEFVELLNADKDLAKLFTFSVADDSLKDEYVEDVITAATLTFPVTEATQAEKEITYDTNLYIPFKTTDNFTRHLAQHCMYTSLKTAPTHGIMGCSKLLDVNLTSVARKVNSLIALDLDKTLYAKRPNGKDMLDRNNMPYPIGRCVSVVLGQYIVETADGYSYISNGAAGYAGMISVLALDQSSTNQPINIPTPMYDLTNYQLGKLTQKGFVTFKQSYTMGIVVTDGITMAPVDSPFRRFSASKIGNAIEQVIRAATEPFIGKPNHLANRNSMQTALKSNLEKLKDKLISAYDFKITVDSASEKLGIVDIDYRVVPIYEIREVRNRITMKDSLS